MLHISDSLYQSLLEINNILVREVTPDSFFCSLAAILQSKINCDRISLTILDMETGFLEWFAKAKGIGVSRMDTDTDPVRGHLARTAIATNMPVLASCLEDYAEDEAIRLMVQAGLRSSMAFPLNTRGRTFGAVVISFLRFIDDEKEFLVDFMEKSCAQISLAVDNMLIHAKINRQNEYLNQQVDTLLSANDITHSYPRFFFNCATMQNLMSQVRLLAVSDAPVLICGETGTGKEFIARFIHRFSPRASHNFIKVNCPALSPMLFESELFGHAKGAFTGASSKRLGRFELADKGSIFLDEIGDLDIVLQAKLLHVLQDAKFERVGESRPVSIDARCISATNADPRHLIHEGRFRRDLFYRLGVTTVQVPPLRDRENEVVPMLHHLLSLYAEDMQCAPLTFHPDTLKMLEDYHWPGNVRELSNLLARLLILHPGAELGPEHVRPLLDQIRPPFLEDNPEDWAASTSPRALSEVLYRPSKDGGTANPKTLAEVEKAHIEHTLTFTGGRVSGPQGAAGLLGVPRSTLQYKMRKHSIVPRDFMKRK